MLDTVLVAYWGRTFMISPIKAKIVTGSSRRMINMFPSIVKQYIKCLFLSIQKIRSKSHACVHKCHGTIKTLSSSDHVFEEVPINPSCCVS